MVRHRSPSACLPFALLCGLACGPSEPAGEPVVSEIAPVSPTGSVAGVAYDAFTGEPLEGVAVRAQVPEGDGAEIEDVTDADGTFLLRGVPASADVALRYRKGSHFEAWDRVSIPSSAGNLAQDNGVAFSGPMALLPRADDETDALEAIVRTGGAPASGALVSAALQLAWLVDGEPRGSLVATVSPAGPGRYTLGALPDLRGLAAIAPASLLRLVVVPADSSSSPRVVEISVQAALEQGAVLVDLPGADQEGRGDFEIVTSDVADLVSNGVRFPTVLEPTSDVQVAFSVPVDEASFFATVIDGDGATHGVTPTIEGGGVSLAIADMEEGQEHFLYLEALPAGAAGEAALLQRGGFFMTSTSQGMRVAPFDAARKNHALRAAGDLGQLRCPADADAVLVLELSQPVGARDGEGAPLGPAELLPLRMTTTTAPLGHRMHPDTAGSPVGGALVDLSPATPPSGFTRRVLVDWVAIPTDTPSGDSTSYQLSLTFNDATLGTAGQDAVVRQAGGEPLGVVQQNAVQVAVREGGCAVP